MPFHAFMQNHPMQPMHFDPSTGGMIPYSSRSPPPHMMMQQQAPQHFAHPQAQQSLFSPGSPFIYADPSGNGNARFLPPPMPPHGHHFYPGPPHMQPHHPMASPQYHPYHVSPPPPSQMMMSPNPYTFVPPGRRVSNQNRSNFGKQQGGRRTSRSALGEALSQSTDNSNSNTIAGNSINNSNNNLENHMSHHYSQHLQSSNHPIPLPYPELLDGIHYAASQHYHPGPGSMPEEEAHGYHSMDGSALMASGVLVQEYIRDALAMIHDEGASNPATQHHVLGVGNDGVEEMKHHHHHHHQHHNSAAPRLERNGSSTITHSE